VDEPALGGLLRFQIDSGVHGIFVLGTAGEGNAVSMTQRARVISIARDEIAGRVPLLAGVGSTCTREAIKKVNHAHQAGAEIVLLTLPHYHTLESQEQAIAFVESVLADTELPIALYNIPARTKLALEVATVVRLAEHERLVAIKDSSGDFTLLQHLIIALKDRGDFAVTTGSSWQLGAALLMGADGAVAPTANFDPQGAVAIYEAARAGDVLRTRELQERAVLLRDIYGQFGMLPGLKYAMSLKNLCEETCVATQRVLSSQQKKRIASQLRDQGFL